MKVSHRMRTVILAVVLLLGVAYVSSAQTPTATQETPGVTVEDQQVANGTVTVQNVVAAEDGWMVIHRSANGTFGDVIGHTFVQAGTTEDVVVPIEVGQATQTLYAMLHIDAGQEGVYEFPGPDAPVQVNGQIVVEPFTVTNFAQLGATPGAVTGTPTAATGTSTAATGTPTAATGTPTAGVGTPTVTATRTATPPQVLPETGQEMTPTATPAQVLPETGQEMTPTATPAQVLPETGQEMTPTATPAEVLPETGMEMQATATVTPGTPTTTATVTPGTPTVTRTATPGQVLPETGQAGPTTPWGLILLVPGIVMVLVGVSMALVTRRR